MRARVWRCPGEDCVVMQKDDDLVGMDLEGDFVPHGEPPHRRGDWGKNAGWM